MYLLCNVILNLFIAFVVTKTKKPRISKVHYNFKPTVCFLEESLLCEKDERILSHFLNETPLLS